MQVDAMKEKIARAMSRKLDGCGDTEAVEQARVDQDWWTYERHAEAAEAVIAQAFAERDAEIADWLGKRLRGHERAFAKAVEFRHDDHQTHYAARAREVEEIESGIRSGEYRKDDHG